MGNWRGNNSISDEKVKQINMELEGKNIIIFTESKKLNNYLSMYFIGKNIIPFTADDYNRFINYKF